MATKPPHPEMSIINSLSLIIIILPHCESKQTSKIPLEIITIALVNAETVCTVVRCTEWQFDV